MGASCWGIALHDNTADTQHTIDDMQRGFPTIDRRERAENKKPGARKRGEKSKQVDAAVKEAPVVSSNSSRKKSEGCVMVQSWCEEEGV